MELCNLHSQLARIRAVIQAQMCLIPIGSFLLTYVFSLVVLKLKNSPLKMFRFSKILLLMKQPSTFKVRPVNFEEGKLWRRNYSDIKEVTVVQTLCNLIFYENLLFTTLF